MRGVLCATRIPQDSKAPRSRIPYSNTRDYFDFCTVLATEMHLVVLYHTYRGLMFFILFPGQPTPTRPPTAPVPGRRAIDGYHPGVII